MFSLIYFFGYPLLIFWMYLWQLKEYHVGRFIDHFRTFKGKRLLINVLLGIKVALLLVFCMAYLQNDPAGYLLLGWAGLAIVYIAEAYKAATDFLHRRAKKPVFTVKMVIIFLIMVVIGATVVVWSVDSNYEPVIYLLVFDILTPIIVSVVVLAAQPFFVMARTRILKKAVKKIAGYKNLKVVGITGSYGKTATKEFLTTILSSKFNVLSTPDHKNSEIGIAKTILESLNENHQIFIVEMGSYSKGGIKLLCDILKPRVGMVTGVNQQHLATFGSMENLLSAEGGVELLKALPKNGTIIVNGDNSYCVDLYKKVYQLTGGGMEKKIYTVGKNKLNADVFTEDVVVSQENISFIARGADGEMGHFDASVLGRQQVQNLLGAILAAKEFGMTFGEIAQACRNIKPGQAGMTLKAGAHGITIIDSSYSSNPDGVLADLDYLSIFPGKKIVVMPCLIELGSASAKVHEQIGAKIAEICDVAIITSKDQFENLKKGALQNGMGERQILLCDKPQEIFSHLAALCKEGDAVLLEGGRQKELLALLKKA